jgi:hypothetical protein
MRCKGGWIQPEPGVTSGECRLTSALTRSAVMVFAPDKATPAPLDTVWGTDVIPLVTEYLGVVLSADCMWHAHAQYVLDKAGKRVHAFGSILHNCFVSTTVRRVVLQAVLRPMVEHGSPVWEPAPEDLRALEGIQTGVLRRMVPCSRNVADDTLRLELGCSPFASWFNQRKLEYAYRLLQQRHWPPATPSVGSLLAEATQD